MINDVFRVALNWSAPASSLNATNVIHFRNAGGSSGDLTLKMNSHVTAGMWGTVSHLASITDVVVTPLDGGSVSVPFLTGSPTKWAGAGGSGDFIPQAATIMKLLTARRGRSYRGRVFLPFVPEASQAQGTLVTGDVDAEAAAWATFMSDMAGDSYDLVVASYSLATADDVVAIAGEYKTATQRRRQKR